MSQIPDQYADPIFSWEERASHQERHLTMLQDLERDLQHGSPQADLSRPPTHAAAMPGMTSLEGERNLNLSRPAAHAAAMTSLEGGATEDLSVQAPCSPSTGACGPPPAPRPRPRSAPAAVEAPGGEAPAPGAGEPLPRQIC